MNASYKNLTTLLIVCAVMLTMVTLTSCKKESEPTVKEITSEVKDVTTEVIEQKTCPIMDTPIDKNLFTEYKGKKVYFCCPGCKGTFEKAPEKYLEKLPQFSN